MPMWQRRIASLPIRRNCTFLVAYLAKVHRIKSKKIISFNSRFKALMGHYFEIWDVGEYWTQNQKGIDSNMALTWQKKIHSAHLHNTWNVLQI